MNMDVLIPDQLYIYSNLAEVIVIHCEVKWKQQHNLAANGSKMSSGNTTAIDSKNKTFLNTFSSQQFFV